MYDHPFVVQLHYKWTFISLVIFVIFIESNSNLAKDLCVSKLDSSTISGNFLKLCKTYAFKENSSLQNSRYYLINHEYLGCVIVLLAIIYHVIRYLPHQFYPTPFLDLELNCISKLPKCHGLSSIRLERALTYFHRNIRRHDTLYMRKVSSHLISLLMNALSFFFVNYLLQANYYASLGRHWPFVREYGDFKDPISSIFPAFAQCELTPKMQFWSGATIRAGCHFPKMEYYEKLFIILWFWQHFLAAITLISLVKVLCESKFNALCYGYLKNPHIPKSLKEASRGDLLALAAFSEYLYKEQLRHLLKIISSEKYMQ